MTFPVANKSNYLVEGLISSYMVKPRALGLEDIYVPIRQEYRRYIPTHVSLSIGATVDVAQECR